jgi:hypothetical protein
MACNPSEGFSTGARRAHRHFPRAKRGEMAAGFIDMNATQIFGNRLIAYQYAFQSRTIRPLETDEEPELGAHLVTPWRGFAHHGIYVGEGRVVHYNARVYQMRRGPVEVTTMQEFHEGRPMFAVDHADDADVTEAVIRRAMLRVGEDRYHLLTNNCEHLVEWCLHGVARSFQVESALDFPRRAGEFWRVRLLRWGQSLFPRKGGLSLFPRKAGRS